jgi:glycosyltransferase involved in cell wall biosynthesis
MDRGGCEGNAICLIEASPELSHHTLVLGEAGAMSGEFAKGSVSIRHDGVLGRGRKKVVGSVSRAVEESKADGVIVWHGMVALPEILHALRDFRGKVLVHGGNPAHSMPRSVDLRHWLREKWLGRRAAATYVCCSQHVADSFKSSLYLRRFRRIVIPNGTRLRPAPAGNPSVDRTEGCFVLGMTARLDRIKDHATLLRSFALVLADFPNARLELAGEGELRRELEELAGELGISGQVRFLGTVPDVAAVHRTWDLFVYTTTDREGFGNALIEAMMSGLPCLATDTGPIREVVGRLEVDPLVPPGEVAVLADRIVSLLRDGETRARLAAAGRKRAEERFSQDVFAKAYLKELHIEGEVRP